MLCTVPTGSAGEADALKYDLVRLAEGNAVYIIRQFAPAGRARDLEWVVKGSIVDDNTIYNQMRKKLLDFEMSNTRLGWCVMGVRKGGATSKYRCTFMLDSPTVYWPWTMSWGHKHGSVPESSPLLNFEPGWSARRPYACQCCYSTDHFMEECPLPFMKVGGVMLVSFLVRMLVLKKKATEWIISLEKSSWELPIPCTPSLSRKAPASPAAQAARGPRAGPSKKPPPPPLSAMVEEQMDEDGSSTDDDTHMSLAATPPAVDPPFSVVDSLVKFLLIKLRGNVTASFGLTEPVMQALCKKHKGSLPATLDSLCRDGWLPASVSNQMMAFDYDRFLIGSPSPQQSIGMLLY